MTALTPEQIAAKWASNETAAVANIQAGVNAVTTAPGQAAARQADAWATNVAAAKPKFARNVAAVSLLSWQSDMINKGIPRIASGVQTAQPKFATFMTKLMPYINQQRASLPPRGNLQQNIARMTAFVNGMSKFSNQ